MLEKLHGMEKGKFSVDPMYLEALYDKLVKPCRTMTATYHSSDVRKFFLRYQMMVAAGLFEVGQEEEEGRSRE
ncbi:MAG: hypothetical protein IPI05_05325 [Flavobacteriales bacterium]|nr:hypothetical protein [Flavobacteriales bacterium]